jgi:hypothetical protein
LPRKVDSTQHRIDQALQLLELLLGLLLAAADEGRDAGQDLEPVGAAAVRGKPPFEAAVKRPRRLGALLGREHHLGRCRGQVLAIAR